VTSNARLNPAVFATRALPWLLLAYCAASLLHFAHNAEFVADYPNLPAWITRGSIYFTWLAIFSIGLGGYLLFRRGYALAGLLLMAIYAALGLDGLLHYSRAPLASHTLAMNMTIWIEAATAALALFTVLWIAIFRRRQGADP